MRRSSTGTLVMVGVTHHTAPVELRERLLLDRERWVAAGGPRDAVLLSTCNRAEVYVWRAGRAAHHAARLRATLARIAGLPRAELEPLTSTRIGRDAILHLVRVAVGLDSLVVGEEQIRGQVRDAFRDASRTGELPGALEGISHRVLQVARRLGAETLFGHRPSVASAGVAVIWRSLTPEVRGHGPAAVVLGAGAMAKAAARALVANGARVVLVNRSVERAGRAAQVIGGPISAASLEELPRLLRSADLLVGATASRQHVVTAELIRSVQPGRGSRPLAVLDLAVPRDVDPAVRDVLGVLLLDMDDLERLCPIDVGDRAAAVEQVESAARAGAETIETWLRVRAAAPRIVALREHGESVRLAELRRSSRRLRDLTPEQQQAVEALTQGIVNKLLHAPTVALRQQATRPRRRTGPRLQAPAAPAEQLA